MSAFAQRKKTATKRSLDQVRMVIIRNFFVVFAVVIIGKLFMLQVMQGSFYIALASGQHEIYKTLFPQRGEIFVEERSSVQEESLLYPLATNKDFKTVYAQPKFISNPLVVAEALAPILQTTPEELMVKLDKPDDPYEVLARKLTDEQYYAIDALKIEGIKFQNENLRYYPEGQYSGHVTGFVGISNDQRVGQYGIEGNFEEILKGVQGSVQSEKDMYGRWIASTAKDYQPAQDGADIVLTLDKNIQYNACRILAEQAEQYEADSATVIIMDPFTGAIMAMCSYPVFDPNEYNKVADIKTYNNTGIFEAYEPGSIFKPITMAAALDMKAVTPQTEFVDNGEVKIDRFTIRNADKKAHGKVSMIDVLDKSLNTGMIFVVQKLGNDAFRRYVENFGFGKRTGVELPSEAGGNISSLSKKGDIYAYTGSFGQGITATPLQMVQAFAVLANGGFLVKPHIVKEIQYEDESVITDAKVLSKVIEPRTSLLIGGMLASVVQQGQAKAADVPGYTVAGKTGTAQIPDFERGGYSTKTNHSFVGYAPLDNPAFVMIVKFENPKVGSFSASTAAPTFSRIAKYVLQYLQVPPDEK